MRKLTKKIKDIALWQLERYPADKKELEQIYRDFIPSATVAASPTAGVQNSGGGRPTEASAIRMASTPYIAALERNTRAVERTLNGCEEIDRKLILIKFCTSYASRCVPHTPPPPPLLPSCICVSSISSRLVFCLSLRIHSAFVRQPLCSARAPRYRE